MNPLVKRPLIRLSFIHAAHWALLRRVGPHRLRKPQLLFQTNFDGDLVAYIDAFSLVVPWRMRAMWQGADGFPGPLPIDRFQDFIANNVTPTPHYWCAYPHASVTMIRAALELQRRHERLVRETAALGDAEFAAAWAGFLEAAQELL